MVGKALTRSGGADTGPAGYRAGLQFLARDLRQRRRPLVRMIAWSALEVAPTTVVGLILSRALDTGFLAGRPVVGSAWLVLVGAVLASRAAIERAMFPHLAEVVEPLRNLLVRHLVTRILAEAIAAPTVRSADAAGVSRLTMQVESVRGLVGVLLRTARPLIVTIAGALVGLALLDPVVVLVVAPPLAVTLALFPLTARALVRRNHTVLVADEQVAAQAGTALLNSRDIAALGAEHTVAADAHQTAQQHAAAVAAVGRIGSLRALLVLLGGYLPLLLLLLASPYWVGTGQLSVGEVASAAVYLTAYLVPALRLLSSTVLGHWTQLLVTLARLVGAASPAAPGPVREAPDGPAIQGADLELAEVSLSYGPAAVAVLRDLTLSIPAGDHLAVVGPSGVGKSTLTKVVAGIETPDRGSVRLGGVPVRGIDPLTRHRMVALIPQEAYVFPGTLRENLRYLAPDATDQELIRMTSALGLGPLVTRLGGYDSEVADPLSTLSSGERQLVALGRTYLSPACVILLDEATCHLDPHTEARVEQAFKARYGTLVVVAHRLSSARRARRVLFLDDPDQDSRHSNGIVGSHTGLVATCPGYARLHRYWDPPAEEGGAPGGR